MSVCLDQVLDYLDHHPICYYADDVGSLLETLYDVYAKHNRINSPKADSLWQDLDADLSIISDEQKVHCRTLINDICVEHEQLAFIHGFIVGLNLMTEIRSVT